MINLMFCTIISTKMMFLFIFCLFSQFLVELKVILLKEALYLHNNIQLKLEIINSSGPAIFVP
jgi:hypothetical protein